MLPPKAKGGSLRSRPFSVLPEEAGSLLRYRLRDVVAEGRKHHVVHSLWRDTHRGGYAVVARPGIPGEVGVLDAPAETALGTLVQLVPETQRAFHDYSSIAGAGSAAGGVQLIDGWVFRAAAAVVREGRAIAAELVQLDRRG